MKPLILFCLALLSGACSDFSKEKTSGSSSNQMYIPAQGNSIERIKKTEAEWRVELNEQEYYVLRQAGTEYAFSGDLWNNKEDGLYTCRACGLPLFESKTKFKSGTGWPSFYEPVNKEYITEKQDRSYGMLRVEVLCARCDGHLGHVFSDGPQPTGLRYCINSVSLDFIEKEEIEKKEP
ncbi:MAG: peptide-methionine (R)-S-oxide reductase MsrB [Saprospiraceae bacterium]|nr:peptide-methionine (R)-S-oxide reductase MsrB [Saprospiraceae bacterium]